IATAAVAAKKPRWIRPSPISIMLRTLGEVLGQSRRHRLVRGQAYAIDLSDEASLLQLIVPAADRRLIGGSHLLNLRDQLLTGFQVVKANLPFQGEPALQRIQDLKNQDIVPHKANVVERV